MAAAHTLIGQIKSFVASHGVLLPFAPVKPKEIDDAERQLGFALPLLLRECYEHIGNGGFGPGYGLIGLRGGFLSDQGDLVGYYNGLIEDPIHEGSEWKRGLLPFCEWGCSIYSCVDSLDTRHTVSTMDSGDISPTNYDLEQFFGRWLDGLDVRSHNERERVSKEITNPFTGKRVSIFGRKRS